MIIEHKPIKNIDEALLVDDDNLLQYEIQSGGSQQSNLNNSNYLRLLAGINIIFFSLLLIGIIYFKFMNKDVRIFTYKYSNNFRIEFVILLFADITSFD